MKKLIEDKHKISHQTNTFSQLSSRAEEGPPGTFWNYGHREGFPGERKDEQGRQESSDGREAGRLSGQGPPQAGIRALKEEQRL